jgi:hypothetical protein
VGRVAWSIISNSTKSIASKDWIGVRAKQFSGWGDSMAIDRNILSINLVQFIHFRILDDGVTTSNTRKDSAFNLRYRSKLKLFTSLCNGTDLPFNFIKTTITVTEFQYCAGHTGFHSGRALFRGGSFSMTFL